MADYNTTASDEVASIYVQAILDTANLEKSLDGLSRSKYQLNVTVDDSALYDLNKHLNISVQHLKQVNQYFKSNVITPLVEDSALTELNKHLNIKVQHLKQVNTFFQQNPIIVATNTKQLDSLEDRLERLGNKTIAMTIDSKILDQYQDRTAQVVEQAIARATRQIGTNTTEQSSTQQNQQTQQKEVQRVQGGFSPLRSIGEGVFENVGKQLSKGVQSSMNDTLGVDMKAFTQIATNSVLRYFGVGKKAQKDPRNNKGKIKNIVEDAVREYSKAVDSNEGVRSELDGINIQSVQTIASNSLLRYFGVGKKAQTDPKNNQARIKSIIEDAVKQYSGTEIKQQNSGLITTTFSEINRTFSTAINDSVNELTQKAKRVVIKEVKQATTNVLFNSSSGVRDSINGLFGAIESGKKGSVGQFVGQSLAAQSKKTVESLATKLFPTTTPIIKEFLTSGNKVSVEKQTPKQRPADGLLEAANQLKDAAKAISESAIKVQSVAPVTHEQIADPWGDADLIPVQIPLKKAKQKTKKDESEPALVLLELPQQTQQHFKTLNAEIGKNTAKSLEFLKATTQENIKQQTTQSITNIKAALAAINQYFKTEYKQIKDAVANAKSTGHIDDINAARSAAKNYQRRSSGAIKEIDRIVKSGEESGLNKEFGSELSQVHATGKGQLVASDKRVGQQLGGLNLLETNQFKKDVKLYTELAKKAGIEIDAGLIKGLDIGASGVSSEARELLNGLIGTVKKTMGIQSPSRVMIPLGMMIAAGLGLGIKNGIVDVSSAIGLLTDHINQGIKEVNLFPVNPASTFDSFVQKSEGSGTKATQDLYVQSQQQSNPTIHGKILGTAMIAISSFAKELGVLTPHLSTSINHLGAYYQGVKGVYNLESNPKLAKEAEIASIFKIINDVVRGKSGVDGTVPNEIRSEAIKSLQYTLGGFNYSKTKQGGIRLNDVYDWDGNKTTPFNSPLKLGKMLHGLLEKSPLFTQLLGFKKEEKSLTSILGGSTKTDTIYQHPLGFAVTNRPEADVLLDHKFHTNTIGGSPYIQTHEMDESKFNKMLDDFINAYQESTQLNSQYGLDPEKRGFFDEHPLVKQYLQPDKNQQSTGLLGQLLPALKKDLGNNPILTNLFSSATKAFGKGGSFKDIGTNLITSFGQGILSSDDGVFGILGTFAKSAIGLVKKIFGIASPSKVMQSIGLDFGKGFENGAVSSLVLANKKIADLILKTVNESETATDLQKASAANFADRVASQNKNIAKKFREGVYNNSNANEASNELAYTVDAGIKSAAYTGVNKSEIPKILQQSKREVNAVDQLSPKEIAIINAEKARQAKKTLSAEQQIAQFNAEVARQKRNELTHEQQIAQFNTEVAKQKKQQLAQQRLIDLELGKQNSGIKKQSNVKPDRALHTSNTEAKIKSAIEITQEIQQPISVKFDPQKILSLTNSLANNVISAVGNSINQTRMSDNATLGQFMRNAVVAAGSAMSGSLMGMLGGHLKSFFPMIMKVALPMAGVAALKLGDATTGNLLKNGIFKQGGFLTELLSAFSGINLSSMGGAGIKSAITGITSFLGVFPNLAPLASIGTMLANAGVTAHNAFGGGGKQDKSVNDVLHEKTAENLKEAGLNSTGNSTADLVENLAETTVGALFRMIGFDGVKASAVQALIKGKVKEHSGQIANAVGGVGNGQISALIDGYVKGDSTQLAGTAESMLKNMGITGLDPKQIKLAANAITATLSGLHAKFGQEGFNLGESISKGFKSSLNNLANAKDDLEYNLKKAVGKANAGDVIGNAFKRMSRGVIVDKGMFDEMWNQVGSAFKKGAFKSMPHAESEGMFGNMMGFMASATAMFAPITTMAASLAPLFIPLMPIIAGISGAIHMVLPQLSKLFQGMQEVEKLQRRFTFLGGSKAGGEAELNYAKGIATKMNVPSQVAADSYSQLAIAARGTKMEGQGVKTLFEGITASLSALGISGQDAGLVFMAYTQIMAKGKLSMEELRQQLGEKFPPAMDLFARAMGVSVSEMNDLVSSGAVLSQDILPKVAKILNADYGKAASGNADSLVLSLTKLGNIGFEITTIFTDKLGGTLAGFVNMFSSGLELLKNSLGTLIPLGQSFVIGFTATIAVGLTVMMTKIKPVVVLLGSLQNLLLSTFSAIASNLMPMIIGITSDVADGWLGAESDLMVNMTRGFTNMFTGLFSMIDSGVRALSGKPLFPEGLIGGKGGNLIVSSIDAIKGALGAVFAVIRPGVVELGALVFMFEQTIALGAMALGPALVGGGKALLGMLVGIKNAFIGTMGTVKIWHELMMTSMNAGAVATEKAAARAMIANEGWKMSMIALKSMATHVAIAMAILMFSKGDFSNPLGDKIGETSKKITVNLNNMKSAALSLGDAFDKAAGQLTNLNNKLTDNLPSKGVQLDIRNFWDKTKSTTSDDLIRNSNRAEVERRQREKNGKQTFGDKALNVADKALKYSGITTPMYLYNSWLSDRLVPKTDDATIDLVKKYGLEKFIAPDKNMRVDMAQSQVIKAIQDSEANTKALREAYTKSGLTKETQQNYLIPEKMGPVGNSFDIDAQLKSTRDKLAQLSTIEDNLGKYNQSVKHSLFASPEQLEAKKSAYGVTATNLTNLGLNSDAGSVSNRDIEAQRNILNERMKELENQRASTAQGVERFKSNKEIQLIDAQILAKVKRGVQLEKANPSDATRKELGGIDTAVLELKTRREKIINGMGSDAKDAKEALDTLEQHKKDILDGADEATKEFNIEIRRAIAKNVDQQIELAKNAFEIAQKSVPAQFGDDLYKNAANKLRDSLVAFERNTSLDKISSASFRTVVNSSDETSQRIAPVLANRQVSDLEKQQRELDNISKQKKATIDAYAAILRYGANKDVKDELEKLKTEVLKDDEQLAQLGEEIAKSRRDIRQTLIDQTKQVADYYRTAVRESQNVTLEFQKAQNNIKNIGVQNKLKEALLGAGDNVYTQFVDGLISSLAELSEISNNKITAKQKENEYLNQIQDIKLQGAELQRSLPGQIIPFDSNKIQGFNFELKDVDKTVNVINKSIDGVESALSKDVVEAAKKANSELDKFNDTVKNVQLNTTTWLDGMISKIPSVTDLLQNGFGGVTNVITDLTLKTSDWLTSLATGQGLVQNLAGGVQSAVTRAFGKEAGQQLEQGAKQLVSNPIGALTNFFGANAVQGQKYKIVESVGSRIESVKSYEDLAKHHPSRGKEAGRNYREINGKTEEVNASNSNLIKKDFVLIGAGGQQRGVPVHAQASGYVNVDKSWGSVSIFSDQQMTKLIGQIGHMSDIAVKRGDYVKYGQIVGKQASVGSGNAVHVDMSATPETYKVYLKDVQDGVYDGVVSSGKQALKQVATVAKSATQLQTAQVGSNESIVKMQRLGEKDANGLEKIQLAVINRGKLIDSFIVNSGDPKKQLFGGAGQTNSGSRQPLEFGRYQIGSVIPGSDKEKVGAVEIAQNISSQVKPLATKQTPQLQTVQIGKQQITRGGNDLTPQEYAKLTPQGRELYKLRRNPNILAIADATARAEGTDFRNKSKNFGYGMLIGDENINDFSGHPFVEGGRGYRHNSSASGRYQMMDFNYSKSRVAKQFGRGAKTDLESIFNYNGKDNPGTFSPGLQDLYFIQSLKSRGVLDKVLGGQIDSSVLNKLAPHYASIQKGNARSAYGGQGTPQGQHGNFLKFVGDRRQFYTNSQNLDSVVIQGGSIQPNQMQQAVTQATQLKLNTANQQHQTNLLTSGVTREQEDSKLIDFRRGLDARIRTGRKSIYDAESARISDGRSVTDMGVSNLFPVKSPEQQFMIEQEGKTRQYSDKIRELQQKLVELRGNLASSQKAVESALGDSQLKTLDPKRYQEVVNLAKATFNSVQTDIKHYSNSLKTVQSEQGEALEVAKKHFDKTEYFRLAEIENQTETQKIGILQKQVEQYKQLEQVDPLNALVLKIPSLERNIALMTAEKDLRQEIINIDKENYNQQLTPKQYQEKLAFVFKQNQLQKESIEQTKTQSQVTAELNKRTLELDRTQFLQQSKTKALQLENQGLIAANSNGIVDLKTVTNDLLIKTNELTEAYQRQALELDKKLATGQITPQQKLIESLRNSANFNTENRLNTEAADYKRQETEINNNQTILNNRNQKQDFLNKPGFESRQLKIDAFRNMGGNEFVANRRSRDLAIEQEKIRYQRESEQMKIDIAQFNLKNPDIAYTTEEISKLADATKRLHDSNIQKIGMDFKTFGMSLNSMVSESVKSLGSGLTELIKGTKSLNDVLDGFFDQILTGFLNQGIQSLLGGLMGGGGGGFLGGLFGGGKGLFYDGGIVPNYALGGIHQAMQKEAMQSGRKPQLAIVHAGEMMIPADRMEQLAKAGITSDSLLGNYANGGVVGNMSKNSASQTTEQARNPGNQTVTVESTVINSIEYVTVDQFREGIVQAVKQGASEGANRVQNKMANSPSFRRSVGI